jgi:hypothetical protein
MSEDTELNQDTKSSPTLVIPIPLVLGGTCLTLLFLLGLACFKPASGVIIPTWVEFLGRFHPVILHFPIGWLMVAVLVEVLRLPILSRWAPSVSEGFSRLIWFLAAGSAVVAVLLGWMLSLGGGYDGGLLQKHQTAGIIAAAGAVTVFALLFLPQPWAQAIRWGLTLLTVGAVTLAGHLGAGITHGEDYLTEFAPAPLRRLMGGGVASAKITPVIDDKMIFAKTVLPILTTSCVSCHGPTKAKGGLRLDSYAAVMKGSDDGPVVVPGDPDKSDLMQRMHLPPDDDDHMPPKGKPQPPEAQIGVLSDWIKSGAVEREN